MNPLPESGSLKPFYFVNVVWGDEHRNYFLEYCLPSLLAPGNIPAITGIRPAKFLIATTAADRDAMLGTAILRELEKHAEPVFLELPQKGDLPYWSHSIVGHKMCCEMTARDGAIRIFTAPDTVYSDGMVARLDELARDGAQAVMALVSPLARTDLVIKGLAELDLLPQKSAR